MRQDNKQYMGKNTARIYSFLVLDGKKNMTSFKQKWHHILVHQQSLAR